MHIKNLEIFTYIDNFDKKNIKKLDKKIHIIIRNYKKRFNNQTLINLINFCKKDKRKIYLSNDIKRAKNLGFDGAYIPSFNKLLKPYNIGIKKKFLILGSAHNVKDLIIKRKQRVNLVFLSSLFKNNKNKKYLGTNNFNLIAKHTKEIIALGGINENNINKLKMLNIKGYASINYFKQKYELE